MLKWSLDHLYWKLIKFVQFTLQYHYRIRQSADWFRYNIPYHWFLIIIIIQELLTQDWKSPDLAFLIEGCLSRLLSSSKSSNYIPKVWRGYVGELAKGTFTIFKDLNNLYHDMQFTIQVAPDNALPCLDELLSRL